MFNFSVNVLELLNKVLAEKNIKKIKRGWKTSDGYSFVELPNKTITDGDMIFDNSKSFFSEVGILNAVQLNEFELLEIQKKLQNLVNEGFTDFLN